MRYPKRSQHKYTKKPYRLRNWPEYGRALRRRGDLTLWFSEEAIAAWHAPAESKPGGQRVYSDLAIKTALTVRSVYHLALRQTEGFLESPSVRLGLNLRIPDHTTLSRRAKCLSVQVVHRRSGEPLHILVDSTGLKVYVDSEWRKHSSRRLWRKLHLVVNAQTGDILASELTTNKEGGCFPGTDSARTDGDVPPDVEFGVAAAPWPA